MSVLQYAKMAILVRENIKDGFKSCKSRKHIVLDLFVYYLLFTGPRRSQESIIDALALCKISKFLAGLSS